jgi:sialidase-1
MLCSWHWQEHGSADGALANECSFAQLENRTLVMNSRNYIGQQTHSVKRAIMWSSDQGASWTEPYFNPDLPDPICEGDMVLGSHTPPTLGVGQPLLFTHPQSNLDRANGTLLMSITGGARWTPLLTYQNGCHSYSQMVQFKDGKLGIVFDDGGEFPPNYDPAHGQCKGITSNQTYVLVELSKSGEVREKELGEPRG